MDILFKESKTEILTDIYRYAIRRDFKFGETGDPERYIEITFVDGKFQSVKHDLDDSDTRGTWYVFWAIAAKITELEKRYAVSSAQKEYDSLLLQGLVSQNS